MEQVQNFGAPFLPRRKSSCPAALCTAWAFEKVEFRAYFQNFAV
jgi:hypothetical protein